MTALLILEDGSSREELTGPLSGASRLFFTAGREILSGWTPAFLSLLF